MFRLTVTIASAALLFMTTAQAQVGKEESVSTQVKPIFPPQFLSFDCRPVNVSAMENRVSVRCKEGARPASLAANSDTRIVFFDVPYTKSHFADDFLSLATTALITDRVLTVTFDQLRTKQTVPGCLLRDCREPTRVWLR